jgi:hypothetical protein
MSTGYTCYIEDGRISTLRDYALICARAFGACVMLRDEAFVPGVVPNVSENSTYHQERLDEAILDMRKIDELNREQIIEMAFDEYRTELLEWNASLEKHYALQKKYDDMYAQVLAWAVPIEYTKLKEFMLQQIDTSRDDDKYILAREPKLAEPDEWLAAKVRSIRWNIEYHTKELADEKRRNGGRVDWINGLVAALPE